MALIKSYQQACEKLGVDPVKNLLFPKPKTKEHEAYNALKEMETIIEASNMLRGKKWIPDYTDSDQEKYYIVFRWDDTAGCFRFHYTNYVYSVARTGTGVRHAIRTDADAEHIGRHFIATWNKWLCK